MSWRDRDGELHEHPPTWTEARDPSPASPHGYRPDDSGASCDLCALPAVHPRHQAPRSTP